MPPPGPTEMLHDATMTVVAGDPATLPAVIHHQGGTFFTETLHFVLTDSALGVVGTFDVTNGFSLGVFVDRTIASAPLVGRLTFAEGVQSISKSDQGAVVTTPSDSDGWSWSRTVGGVFYTVLLSDSSFTDIGGIGTGPGTPAAPQV